MMPIIIGRFAGGTLKETILVPPTDKLTAQPSDGLPDNQHLRVRGDSANYTADLENEHRR
jgi:hypothetical protein